MEDVEIQFRTLINSKYRLSVKFSSIFNRSETERSMSIDELLNVVNSYWLFAGSAWSGT